MPSGGTLSKNTTSTTALALGGTNDADNHVAVRRVCLAKIIQDQWDQAGLGKRRAHTMASILSPAMHDIFTEKARPPQVAHKISERPEGAWVANIDANGCRTNGLFRREA